MIDHLIRATDKDALRAILPAWFEDGAPDASRAFFCRVYTVTGTTTDGDGNTVETRAYEPWDYLWLALDELDTTIAAMPECMIAADRDAAERGDIYVRALRIPPDKLPDYFVEPVMAGSGYPFGANRGDQA